MNKMFTEIFAEIPDYLWNPGAIQIASKLAGLVTECAANELIRGEYQTSIVYNYYKCFDENFLQRIRSVTSISRLNQRTSCSVSRATKAHKLVTSRCKISVTYPSSSLLINASLIIQDLLFLFCA